MDLRKIWDLKSEKAPGCGSAGIYFDDRAVSHSFNHLYQTPTTLDDERVIAAEQVPVAELPKRALELKQTPSDPGE